ncbi:MAG: hypothetical protein L0J14_06490, partial [Bifidobacterium crudilactis]|nr:hypothetical protein [Bifidobacterium crudilactis]
MTVDMTWLQLVLLCVVFLVLAAILGRVGFLAGRQREHRRFEEMRRTQHSIFDDSVSVTEVEQGLIEVMPDAVMIVNGQAQIRYCSPGAKALGLVSGDSLNSPEIT